MSQLPAGFPPVVYVPCIQSGDELRVKLRTTLDGQVALLVYSAFDRLHDCVGNDTPWAVFTTADLQKIYDDTPFGVLLMDMVVPEDARTEANHA